MSIILQILLRLSDKFTLSLILLLFWSTSAHAITCEGLLSDYKVPQGFNQEIYDISLHQFRLFTDRMITHNPDSEFSIYDKQHVLSLVSAASLRLEDMDKAEAFSERLPSRYRPLFLKMAALMATALSGDLDEIIKFLKTLVEEERYQEWLNAIADLHRSIRNLPTDVQLPYKLKVTDSIKEYFNEIGFNLNQVYDEDSDTLSYPQIHGPLDWQSVQSLTSHFIKRTKKDGMDLESERDLVREANRFLEVSKPNQIVFYRNDGTLVKYDSVTSEMAIVSNDNKIITYYFIKYRPPEELAAYMKYVFREPPKRS